MKTALPTSISSIEEANKLLKELYENGESFHPEDDVFDLDFDTDEPPTWEEKVQLDYLFDQMYEIEEYDPCEYLEELINQERNYNESYR